MPTMMSSFSKSMVPHLLRRPLLLPTNTNNNSTTILYNQYARRLASTSKHKKHGTGKKKRSLAASKHKRKLAASNAAANNSGGGSTNAANKIKKPSKQAPPPPSPTPTAKLEKARHMQTNTLSTNNEGLLGWFAANPLLFAAVFFPTITMGVVMIFRPEVRPKFLGGDGVSRKSGLSNVSEQDAPVYEDAAAKEAPVYEQSTKDEEWEMVEAAEAVEEVENEGNVNKEITVLETKRGGDIIDLIYAIGIRPHSKEKEEDGKEIDLISAVGIRPYPS